jgi:hypothetical protein
MDDVRNALTAACRERGITGPADFHARFGVAPAALTPQAAIILVATPEWVTAIWIPNSGGTPVGWIPAAVRAYAAAYAVTQREGECDLDFNDRLRREIYAIREGDSHAR